MGGRALRIILLCALVISLVPATAVAEPPTPPESDAPQVMTEAGPAIDTGSQYVEGEVIVRFKSAISVVAAREAHGRAGAVSSKAVGPARGTDHVKLKRGVSVQAAIDAYSAMPEVLYAQPNYRKHAQVTSDPLLSQQTGLSQISMEEGWAHAKGNRAVVIAVIDTGVDYLHPDLAANMWRNPGEIAGNRLDDDGNGYIDDVYGIDIANHDSDPMDDVGHGTHVAGIVGAVGDNSVGVSGVNQQVSLMAIKMLDRWGDGTTAGMLEAFQYIAQEQAKVANCSWGGNYPFDQAEYDAIQAANSLVVCAAGNAAQDLDGAATFYPAEYPLDNIVAVAAADRSMRRASFSNVGATTVDIFAPGVDILSTYLPERTVSIAPGASVRTLFSDSFGSFAPKWERYYFAEYARKDFFIDTTSYTSAPSSAANTGYLPNQLSLLQSIPVDLRAADYPGLRFRVRSNLLNSAAVLYWGVYDTQHGYTTLGSIDGSTGGLFESVLLDLGDFARRSDVRVWFEFATGSVGGGPAEGVWIDDVEFFDLDSATSARPWTVASDYSAAYAYMDGTSMAAPFVAGAAGLLLARDSSLAPATLKAAIMNRASTADLRGLCVSGSYLRFPQTLLLTNRAPTASPDSFSAVTGRWAHLPAPGLTVNDTDPDGDPLRAQYPYGAKTVNGGTVYIANDGLVQYQSAPDFAGTDSFTYTASDGFASSAPVTVTIEVRRPPVANFDYYEPFSGVPLSVPAPGLLGNDSDEGGRPLSVTWYGKPLNGTLTVNPNGSFVYTANPGFTGFDAFPYRISNGVDESDTGQVDIWVRPCTVVYRFYNVTNGSHFYTSSAEERDTVAARWPAIYTYEGVAYTLDPYKNSQPLYRFYNRQNGAHFYTASPSERDLVIARWSNVFSYDGETYSVTPTGQPGAAPVYRFLNLKNGSHFYTASADERDTVIARWPTVYSLEGPAFWLGQ